MRKLWVVLAAAVPAVAEAAGQSGAPPLEVSAVRFYSTSSGTTTIEGVCELRLEALARGATAVVRYRLEVAVFDSAGLELQHSDFQREVPAAVATASGATSVETFSVRAAPGKYTVRVRAIPDSGPMVEGSAEVRAYADRPPISDLLVATSARAAPDDSSAATPGEVRRDGLLLRTAPVPHLSPVETSLSYYAEVYSWLGAAADGEVRVAVLGADEHQVVETAPQAVHMGARGGVTRGSLDLAGLPEGAYRLRLQVRLGDSTIAAEAPFAMGPMSSVVAAAGAAPPREDDPFAEASEATLDSMYAPLIYLMEPSEQGVYQDLAIAGKRRYLRDFWARRNPTPGAASNPAMTQFYRAVDYANQAFREGGAAQIPGWRTDRGRIYLRYGPWDEILQRPMASPRPFVVWKYTRDRYRYYVFVDQSGYGHYVLIGSNDRREPGLQNWQTYLLRENYQEVARFLGLSEQQPQQ
jgi:GWxTD domain-containing protein